MKLVAGLILSLLLVAPLAGQEKGDAEMSVRAARQRLIAAERRGDAGGILEAYADDVSLFPPGEEPVSGRPAVGRWLEAAAKRADASANGRFETLSLEAYGTVAVEVGQETPEDARPGRTRPILPIRHLTVWRRQPDGEWKILRDIWNGSGDARPSPTPARAPGSSPPGGPARPPAAATEPAGAPPGVPAAPEKRSPEELRESALTDRERFVPMPDPSPLSDGFTRAIQDKLHSRARKIRSLATAPPSADRDARLASAEKEAARFLESTIREIGWIDLHRFGVSGSCDAAGIVEKSGDRRLLESTLPVMEKELKNSEGSACYAAALRAYDALPPKN
jgi:ketosteroid isomerase-like protein